MLSGRDAINYPLKTSRHQIDVALYDGWETCTMERWSLVWVDA
jgi:hypothetical protein